MDVGHKYDNPNPEVKASLLSKVLYCWLIPLFKYGYRNAIEVKDLYAAAPCDQSNYLGNNLERNWQQELLRTIKTDERPSLKRVLQSTFMKTFIFYGILVTIQIIVGRIGQTLILALLIKCFDQPDSSELQKGWLLGTVLILNALVTTTILDYSTLALQRVGMQCRIATSSLIYRKLLRLNKSSVAQTTAGQIVNLLSNDVSRFDLAASLLHEIWTVPLLALIIGVIMYYSIGIAAPIGILALVIQTIPLQGYLSRLNGKLRAKIAKQTDQRVQLMREIISGIRVIKMFCWEKPFEQIVTLIRSRELGKITTSAYVWGSVTAIARFIERFSMFITLMVYVFLGGQLTAEKVFTAVQYYSLLQLHIAMLLPKAVSSSAEAKISIKRIEEFLLLDETPTPFQTNIKVEENCGLIKIKEVKASWVQDQIVDTLNNINLDIKPGMLYAIVGPIGSGKSSLLQLFLKELPITQGNVEIIGSISYASQEPWLFGSSVQKNILFGLPYIEEKYKTVVKICALERDFKLFPNGDNTLVGERGTLLSGGQRARINLARAIYREADIYLLDDPLSAVDAHVSKHLFNECILHHLKNKTRILVTHQLQFLKDVDQIILIKNGRIEKIGSYREFANDELEQLEPIQEESLLQSPEKDSEHQVSMLQNGSAGNDNNDDNVKEPTETQELMEKGKIPTSLYIQYFRSGNGIWFLLFLAFIIIIAQVSTNAIDLWLTYWTNSEELHYRAVNVLNNVSTESITNLYANASESDAKNVNTNSSTFTKNIQSTIFDYDGRIKYIYIYAALIVLNIAPIAARSIFIFKICLNASRKMHEAMFGTILRATMKFFDCNPTGRILNRFSKDLGIVDELLPRLLFDAAQILSIVTGTIIVIFSVTPWMMVPGVLLITLFLAISKVFLTSSQNIKRIEGLTKSPVLSHVSASIDGLTTIRVSQAQALTIHEFDILQDQHTSSFFLYFAISIAFGFYMDVIVIIFTAILIYQFLILDSGHTLGGNVGLALTQAFILCGKLQYGVRQTVDVSNHMTSVERVMQYGRVQKENFDNSLISKRPPKDWPQIGQISFRNLTLHYNANEPAILKHLNFDIKAGSKVGIVGRTGAGKSSLIVALFRLAPTEGSIIIDDVDIMDVGLQDVRRQISIIPQEPILFTASIRYNLDPSEKFNDENIWRAINDVELKMEIESLDQKVSEGGSNFSVGQRQLLCLARAILQNNKILIMDEATANVDVETDELIQATVRKHFKDCTVLTIAHRLNTIMDSDKVLVMNAGEVVEYGHPFELLQNKDGFLTKMLKETGMQMENKLHKIAEDTYMTRFRSTDENNEFLD